MNDDLLKRAGGGRSHLQQGRCGQGFYVAGIMNRSITKRTDAGIAKNHLSPGEFDTLSRIVSLYLDSAELQAKSHKPMYMKDWIQKLDEFLALSGKDPLTHAVTISAEIAKQKAYCEYDKYRKRIQYELSPVEIHFIESFENEVKHLKK